MMLHLNSACLLLDLIVERALDDMMTVRGRGLLILMCLAMSGETKNEWRVAIFYKV